MKTHILPHTGIRGIAAVCVSFLHIHFDDLLPEWWEPFSASAANWFPVDVFFMLSGFILAYTYIRPDRLPGDRNTINYKEFFVKRLARIYPLHLLTILVVGAMALGSAYLGLQDRGYHLSELPSQLLLINAFPFIEQIAWNHPSWSISVEFFAYICLFPILFSLMARNKNTLFLTVFIVILMIIWALGPSVTSGFGALNRVTCHFAIGFSLCRLASYENGIKAAAERYVSLWLFLFVALICFNNLLTFPFVVFKFAFQIGIILIILGTANNKDTFAKKILGNRMVVWLGTISYSIYMLHALFGKVIHVATVYMPAGYRSRLMLAACIYLIIILCSWVVFKYFEKPCQKAVVRFYRKRVEADHKVSQKAR